MPFVRISLSNKHSLETQDHIATAVRESLVREFHVPHDDFFQVIEAVDAAQIKYPKSFMGITHDGNIVYVQIFAAQGRTIEQKRKLYAQIAGRISESTNIMKNNVIIVLVETGRENWSLGNGELQEFKHLSKL